MHCGPSSLLSSVAICMSDGANEGAQMVSSKPWLPNACTHCWMRTDGSAYSPVPCVHE